MEFPLNVKIFHRTEKMASILILLVTFSLVNMTFSTPDRNSQIYYNNRRRSDTFYNSNRRQETRSNTYDPDRVVFPDDIYNTNYRTPTSSRKTVPNEPIKNTTRNEMPLDLALRLNELGDVTAFLDEFVENKDKFHSDNNIAEESGTVSLSIGSRAGFDGKSTKGGFSIKQVCSPVTTTIRLAPENHLSNVLYLPECAHVKRCSGCCNTPILSCQPIQTKNITFRVFENKLLAHKKKLRYSKSFDVEVEEHLSCGCKCRIQAHHCQSTQRYESQSCRCVCNYDSLVDGKQECESFGKIWDDATCSCNCPEDISKHCTSESAFSDDICTCV